MYGFSTLFVVWQGEASPPPSHVSSVRNRCCLQSRISRVSIVYAPKVFISSSDCLYHLCFC